MSLPTSWCIASVADCCDVILGQSPSGDTYNEAGMGLPFFQGKAEFGPLFPTVKKWCTAPTKIAESGDILISVRAPVGPTNLCPEAACIGRGLAALRPSGEISSKYLLYAMRSSEERLRSEATGTTFEAISGKKLRAHQIPIAPLREQQRIVDEIEKQFTRLDDAVAALKRVQANLKRYRASVLSAACEGRLVPTEAEAARKEGRSYQPANELLKRILAERRAKWEAAQLQKMIDAGKPPKDDAWKKNYKEPEPADTTDIGLVPEGWAVASMDELTTNITSGSRDWSPFYGKGSGVFIMAQNIRPGKFDLSFKQLVDPPENDASRVRSAISKNDLLVTIVGANTGDICRIAADYIRYYVCQSVALMRPVLSDIAGFLELYMCSEKNGQRQYRRYIYGAGRPHLSFDQLRMTAVLVPPLAEMGRILAEVESKTSVLDSMCSIIEGQLRHDWILRQTILRSAFLGKLVAQDLNDEPASVLLDRIRSERDARRPVQQVFDFDVMPKKPAASTTQPRSSSKSKNAGAP
jgi:type I restriction enzyme S subunit